MATSGVKCKDECISEYKLMKKDPKRLRRCIIYKVSECATCIEIQAVINKNPDVDQQIEYEEIIEKPEYLPPDEGRFIVWDMSVRAKSSDKNASVMQDIIVFMHWVPDDAAIKKKMLSSTSVKALKGHLEGISCSVECHDKGDLDYNDLEKAMSKK